MEMEECDQDGINAIGNWCKDVFHEHYSSNLPLGAMRSLAGFDNRYVSVVLIVLDIHKLLVNVLMKKILSY